MASVDATERRLAPNYGRVTHCAHGQGGKPPNLLVASEEASPMKERAALTPVVAFEEASKAEQMVEAGMSCMPSVGDEFVQGQQEALYHAANYDDFEEVELLIRAGADPNKLDNYGYPPLHYAARNGYLQTVSALLKNGANVQMISKSGSTALMESMTFHYPSTSVQVLRTLIDAGSDLNLQDPNGWTALHFACFLGFDEGVRMLLQCGANASITSNNGEAPVQLASRLGHTLIVTELLKTNQVETVNTCIPSSLISSEDRSHETFQELVHGVLRDVKHVVEEVDQRFSEKVNERVNQLESHLRRQARTQQQFMDAKMASLGALIQPALYQITALSPTH